MKTIIAFILLCNCFVLCTPKKTDEASTKARKPIEGTWRLLTGTVVDNGVTTVTDYTKDLSFIKIINDTHFAFLLHDLHKGKDSSATYVSGGGKYSLTDSSYTEHLEYCSDRKSEGYDFTFTVSFNGDTLVQSGIEKVENVSKFNTEKYVRLK